MRLVLVTAPGPEARLLARRVVEERLAACANLIPGVESVYRWQGGVEEAAETLLVLKTTAARVEALRARVRALHSYDVPEFLVLPVEGGLEPYLAWVRASVAEGEA
ncbi:MAG: divalent-cation tolerance protein CutA [Longimicrobiales bacterium]|nr:divalent-cation tolerance protein CutA [Longimicrobiales bacterium]